MLTVSYDLPYNGLGTDFSQYERPISFAETYTNRFRNITGGAERRPGMLRYGSQVPTIPNLTRLHELVTNVGVETLLSSDDFGNIYTYSVSASAWSTVRSGGASVRYISAEADGKLIFVNGVDRNLYTENGTSFKELKALITTGILAAGSNATTIIDGNISNWVGGTLVANNDIVHNVTLNAYGVVTAVASASLTITSIANTGAGNAPRNNAPGDAYELLDYVDLNVIPIGATNGSDGLGNDNVATATAGTTGTVVVVSGVNFGTTETRSGDVVYNTTRAAMDFIRDVSANVTMLNGIAGQVAGDALVFFKSAMPIASWVHTHFGRVYYLDSRNNNRVVISAPDDPQDVTTYQKTLDSTSFNFGAVSPLGDALTCMNSFLSYFVAAGQKNVYIYKGSDPILDSSSSVLEFEPIASYPNGTASRFGLTTNGADLLYMSTNGLQAVNIGYNTSNTVQNNASVPIRNTLINLVANTSANQIQTTYYPTKAWTINKVGDSVYILNTNPSYGRDGKLVNIASWHLFNGKWAQQNHYFVRRDGTLLACGNNGLVYQMDTSAATDDGTKISTDLTTAWLTLEEPQQSVRIKEVKYIMPVFESGDGLVYDITGQAGWDNLSNDSIQVIAGGGGAIGTAIIGTTPVGAGEFAQANKYPFRLRGQQLQLEFSSESSAAPDIITGFSVYGNVGGWR